MNLDEINDVTPDISMNDYVTVDIKPRRSVKGFFGRFKKIRMPKDKFSLLAIPLFIVTAVSLGFLIAQIAEAVTLSATISLFN